MLTFTKANFHQKEIKGEEVWHL